MRAAAKVAPSPSSCSHLSPCFVTLCVCSDATDAMLHFSHESLVLQPRLGSSSTRPISLSCCCSLLPLPAMSPAPLSALHDSFLFAKLLSAACNIGEQGSVQDRSKRQNWHNTDGCGARATASTKQILALLACKRGQRQLPPAMRHQVKLPRVVQGASTTCLTAKNEQAVVRTIPSWRVLRRCKQEPWQWAEAPHR